MHRTNQLPTARSASDLGITLYAQISCVCCSVLQFAYSVLQCVLQCVAVCCSVLQCVAVCCSVLQCVAVFRSASHITLTNCQRCLRRQRRCVYAGKLWLLQCVTVYVAVCIAVYVAVRRTSLWARTACSCYGVGATLYAQMSCMCFRVFPCVAVCCDVCCRVLQSVTVCCSVLQCVLQCVANHSGPTARGS